MRVRAVLGACVIAMGIAAGRPGVAAADVLKELQDQVKAHPDDADARMRLAQLLQTQGKPPESRRQLDEAKRILETVLSTTKEPGAIRDAARQLAVIAMRQNILEVFLVQADSELSLNPESPAARWKVIEGYTLSKKPEAVGRLTTLLTQTPRSEMLRVRLAQAHAGNGQLEQGLSVLEDGVKMDPDSQAFAEAVPEVYLRANQRDEAIKHYETLLAKSTDERRKGFYRSRIDWIQQSKTGAAPTRTLP